MRHTTRILVAAAALALGAASASPAHAQGKSEKKTASTKTVVKSSSSKTVVKTKGPKISKAQALTTTRDLLSRHGYEVVRVEQLDAGQVIWYRRGNMGRGKGKGPLVRMVVRPATTHYVVEAPGLASAILKEITVKLSWN
jgi:hypothetical protein